MQSVRTECPNVLRQRLYRRAIVIAIAGNMVLAAMKSIVAGLSGSSAVFSDAANSVSDVLYSVLMATGLYLARQPPDESHPQGHSRFEPLVGLVIAGAMGTAGFTALREGVARFLSGATAIVTFWPTVVLVAGAVVKVVMYILVVRIGREADSPAIRASAGDNLADVLTSAAALVGVWGSLRIHPLFDPLAGILVAFWIFRTVWEIALENVGYLTGRGASPERVRRIINAASSVPGVLGVHQVIADHVGPRLRVDMHVDMDGSLTLHAAHEIADRVQTAVEALPDVDLAFVHVEPVEVNPSVTPPSSPSPGQE